jgi:hypothetical protein
MIPTAAQAFFACTDVPFQKDCKLETLHPGLLCKASEDFMRIMLVPRIGSSNFFSVGTWCSDLPPPSVLAGLSAIMFI